MEHVQGLSQDHPSFGCGQAFFQFAIQASDGAIRKFLLVEATNCHAVATIELILSVDGRVSDTCSVMCVARNSPDFACRSELVEDCSYADFLIDIVDSDRLLKDAVVCHFFNQSLSPEERQYISAKTATQTVMPTPVVPASDARPIKKTSKKSTSIPQGAREEMVLSCMTRMGFNKASVIKWVESKGETLYSGSDQDVIREALQALAS